MWRTQRWRRWWTTGDGGICIRDGGIGDLQVPHPPPPMQLAHEGPAGPWSVVNGQWCAAGPAGAATSCTNVEVDCQPGQDPGRDPAMCNTAYRAPPL